MSVGSEWEWKTHLWRGRDLDLGVFGCESDHLLQEAITKAFGHRASTSKYDVSVQLPSHVQISPADRVGDTLMDTAVLQAHQLWMEESFRCSEDFCA